MDAKWPDHAGACFFISYTSLTLISYILGLHGLNYSMLRDEAIHYICKQ